MVDPEAQYHAHVYFDEHTLAASQPLQEQFQHLLASGSLPGLVLVGKLFERPAGPHPKPQFELHFLASALPQIVPLLKASGLTCLVHPLTADDLADHTTLAEWIGEPLPLDETVLDPPGHNQGLDRFGKTHF